MNILLRLTYPFQKPLSILTSSVSTLLAYPIIFLPFILTAFLELLCLEILYFIPKYPEGVFFAPIIKRLWGEMYLHYPSNFYLLPQFFQNIQIWISLLIGSFMTATAVSIFVKINNDETIDFKATVKQVAKKYVHIVVAAGITLFFLILFLKLYEVVFIRAQAIRSTTGMFYLLKNFIIDGRMSFSFLISVLTTTLVAYVYPIIIVENKNVFAAIWKNLKIVVSNFFSTFTIIFVSSLLFIPVFALKFILLKSLLAAEWTVLMITFDILAMLLINAIIYTAVTTNYLLIKDEQS